MSFSKNIAIFMYLNLAICVSVFMVIYHYLPTMEIRGNNLEIFERMKDNYGICGFRNPIHIICDLTFSLLLFYVNTLWIKDKYVICDK